MDTNEMIEKCNENVKENEMTGKTRLISSKNVKANINNNMDDLTKKAVEIAEKLKISNNIIYSSSIEIIKMIINLLKDSFEGIEITYFEFKQIINILMMNNEKAFLNKVSNISEETKKQVSRYYSMQDETQTAVMTEILFGLRKVKESEKLFE